MLDYANDMDRLPQRALLKSLGVFGEDLQKPVVGIVMCADGLTPGQAHLKKLAECAALGVWKAGGLPVNLNVGAANPLLALGHHGSNFMLPQRELVADSLEGIITAYGLDALVLLPDSPGTAAGMLMAAARKNTPAVVLPGGNTSSKIVDGQKVKFASIVQSLCNFKAGALSLSALEPLENSLSSDGTIHSIYQTETFFMVLEALGFSLPDACCIPGGDPDRLKLAKDSGAAAVTAFEKQITPARLLTRQGVKNALTAGFALGATANSLLNLRALAAEAKASALKDLTPEAMNLLADKTPKLCSLFPYSAHMADDFYRAGGVRALLAALSAAQLVATDAINISGDELSAVLPAADDGNEVIRSVKNAYMPNSGVCFLKGNLAEESAFADYSLMPQKSLLKHGVCKVFDSEEEAVMGIMSGTVRKNTFLVVRGEGPKGGPGMRELLYVFIALKAAKLDDSVTLITDGRVPGTTAGGVISLCAPEAVTGGLIAGLKDGDTVEMDIPRKKLAVKLSAREVDGRMRKPRVTQKELSGWLSRYANSVSAVGKGCVLE